MINVKHLRDVNLDENYPYLQKSFWFKCQRIFYWLMHFLLQIPRGCVTMICSVLHFLQEVIRAEPSIRTYAAHPPLVGLGRGRISQYPRQI